MEGLDLNIRILLTPFLTSFGVSLALTWVVRALARKVGAVVQPQDKGRHRQPPALFGGMAITLTVLGCAVAFDGVGSQPVLLVCGLLILLVGLTDEVVGLLPSTKLAAQIALASVFLFFHFRLGLAHSLTLDSFLTVVWIVGMISALDALDSLDGLCGGIALIACFAYLLSSPPEALGTPALLAARFAAILSGTLAGFLVYGVHPASIFMGDSGSMFIGLSLAVLALVPGASPDTPAALSGGSLVVLLVVMAPTAAWLAPTVGPTLVGTWRVISGRPVAAGARALSLGLPVAARLSERAAVAVLWALAALGGAVTAAIRHDSGSWLTRLAQVVFAAAFVFVVLLLRVGAYNGSGISRNQRHITPVVTERFYTSRAAEMMFDFCLVLVAYYGAYRIRFPDAFAFRDNFYYFLTSLPVVLIVQMVSFFAVGAYRGTWKLFGVINAWTFARGVFFGAIGAQLVLLNLFRFENYPRVAFAVYAVMLFLLVTGSRAAFGLIHEYTHRDGHAGIRPRVDGAGAGAGRSSAGLRVVRIITRLNIGGPAIQAASLSQRLGAFGYETLLVYGRLSPGEGDMSYLLPRHLMTQMLPALGRAVAPVQDFRALWRIYRTLCWFRPVIVHTHTAKAGAVGRLAAIAYNLTAGRHDPARLIHTYHGHVFEGYFGGASTSVFIAIERWLARRTNVLIAISERVRTDLLETYRIAQAAQVRVIPLGFDLSPFAMVDDAARARARIELGIPSGRSVVTTVGRLTEIKQHHLFLEMATLLTRGGADIEFLVAGDGELRDELEALAEARGLAERARFLGWRTDLSTIYAATDVFVLTSRNEGTPVALIEAMASGVPGVSTDVGGVRDVIVSPEVGVVVPFGQPETLAAAVTDLLGSPARRRAMGAQARDVMLSRFHLDRLLSDMAGLYRDLLPRRRSAPVAGKDEAV